MNNLPNRLTILRMVLVPLIIFFMLAEFTEISVLSIELEMVLATITFAVASITDWFDGYLARKLNLVTNFGKVMDPLADKLIVVAVILCLIEMGSFPVWCAMIILARDFLITGMRVVAVAEGISVAASMWGKVKTTIQMISMILAILFAGSSLNIIAEIAIYLTTAATLISGITYVYDYRKIFEK